MVLLYVCLCSMAWGGNVCEYYDVYDYSCVCVCVVWDTVLIFVMDALCSDFDAKPFDPWRYRA